MGTPLIIPRVAEIRDHVDQPLGTTSWIVVSQERIDAFADATGDHQWIHTDVERAAAESPWKGTIAHGYLTLSLVPTLLTELVVVANAKSIVNAGAEKVKLSAPVPAGARVRMSGEIKGTRDLPGGGVRVAIAVRLEVEGNRKPACLATVTYVYYA